MCGPGDARVRRVAFMATGTAFNVRGQQGSIPSLGLGTATLFGDRCKNAVFEAIKMGYRHLDTALLYDNQVSAVTLRVVASFCHAIPPNALLPTPFPPLTEHAGSRGSWHRGGHRRGPLHAR